MLPRISSISTGFGSSDLTADTKSHKLYFVGPGQGGDLFRPKCLPILISHNS